MQSTMTKDRLKYQAKLLAWSYSHGRFQAGKHNECEVRMTHAVIPVHLIREQICTRLPTASY